MSEQNANIKIELTETRFEDVIWIQMVQFKIQKRTSVNMAINLQTVHKRVQKTVRELGFVQRGFDYTRKNKCGNCLQNA
jgi:hypothetical protein